MIIRWLKKIPTFFQEIKEELKKVNWSNKQELTGTLLVVVVVLVLLTSYFFVIDLGLSRFIQYLLQG
ncbi:MAG: preprotein translocase subunit SecE [Candidatus Omnitrophota bacterium]